MMRSRFAAILLGALLLTAGLCHAQDPDGPELWEYQPDPAGVALDQLFTIIHQNTGISILYNPNDPAVKNKKVFFTGRYRVPRDRIFHWLQAVLSYQKLVLVPVGPLNYEQYAVLNVTDPSIANHPVYVPEEELEKWRDRDGVFIHTTFNVKKLRDTTRARTALANLVTRPTGRIQDVPGTQSFVVADFAPVVYSIGRLVRAMDIENIEYIPVFKVVPLVNAVATEMEPILQDLLSAAALPGRPASRPRGNQGFAAPEKPDPVIRADPRLEAIIVYAVEEDVVRIEQIINELDAKVTVLQSNIQIYQCQHTIADELAETLNELIRDTGLGSGASSSRNRPTARRPQPAGGGGASQTDTDVVIVADPVSNSLLVQASKTQYQYLHELISKLDVRRPQVLIEAALIELRVSDNLRFGVELAATGDLGIGKNGRIPFGASRFGLTELQDLDGDGLIDINIPLFGTNGFTGGIFNNDQFPLVVQAFKGISNARALTMPSIVVDDGRNAHITSSQSEPFTETETTSAGTDRENVEYVDVETTLRISPHISSSNYLKLHIELEVSSFGSRLSPSSAPPTQSRNLSTDIVVPDRATLVMGGIIDDRKSDTVSKIPILGDIPFLGELFKNTSKEVFKTNLFLFVTPTILGRVEDSDEEYFAKYHEVSWSRKLLADELIDEEIQIYNSRFKAMEQGMGERPANAEAELREIEESGLTDFPSFGTSATPAPTRGEAKSLLEREQSRVASRR